VGIVASWLISLTVSLGVGLLIMLLGFLLDAVCGGLFFSQFFFVIGLGVAAAGSLAVRKFLKWLWVGILEEWWQNESR